MRLQWIRLVLIAGAAIGALSSAAEAQVKAGPEFRANTYTALAQMRPAVAAEPDGDFVVVWQSSGQDGSSYGIFGQRYDAAGNGLGAEFQVNAYTTGLQEKPQVAAGPRGFVVVWNSALQDGSSTGVFGQLFDAAGGRVGGEFQVNTYTTNYQGYPHAAMGGNGSFMVVWESSGQDGSSDGVYARRYDRAGNAIGAEFQVNTYTTAFQETAHVALNASGAAVVVWESPQDGSGDGIYGQRFDPAGARVGGEFQVNTTTLLQDEDPKVGIAADGGFVVAFEDRSVGAQVRARVFDPSGNPLGPDFQVNTYTTGSRFLYGMAVDPQGNFIIAWDDFGRDGDSFGVFGYRFLAGGTRRGAEFQANTFTTNYQGLSDLAVDSAGNFIVAWHSTLQDGSGRGVYGQRFGGLVPRALQVDQAGNRVWDPGETAVVQPSWQNTVGSAQTFSSTLSNLAGPAGPSYAIVDGIGDYGTVPDGSVQACTDCFSVSVSGARPVLHWDASALETISPDVQGQMKTWVLHVGGSFTDVSASSPFYRFVETLLHHGVTGGCGADTYCPGSSTTREQMAVFVLVGREGAGYTPPACVPPNVFDDVPETSPFCRFVEELARRNVVTGCGGANYCPSNPVLRDQMAVFVLRTLDPDLAPPACVAGSELFGDVPASSPFCRWVEELARRGVVTGCGGGNYCPAAPVTREQMGVFISATFGLTLYGP